MSEKTRADLPERLQALAEPLDHPDRAPQTAAVMREAAAALRDIALWADNEIAHEDIAEAAVTHHLHDNGDLVIADSNERPLAKLQSEGTFIVTVGHGKHVFDALCGALTTSDLEAIRDWCERELEEGE